MNSHYSQQDYWNMLPLNQEQRKKIIKDFIETGEYDKIEKKEMKEIKEEKKEELRVKSKSEAGKIQLGVASDKLI